MPFICFYFQVHQPKRVKDRRFFNDGGSSSYFDFSSKTENNNRGILNKVSRKCYLPANNLLLRLLKKYPEFRVSFSMSGTVLEQFQHYAPEVLDSFQALVRTGQVEILSETYNHSLAFLYSNREFRKQISLHRSKVKQLFGVRPTVFRNTELIYSNQIAELIGRLGFKAMLAEGADHVLKGRSPNFLYRANSDCNLKLFLKNYRLSDDIAFRFSDKSWSEYPLSPEKFCSWISNQKKDADIINLFMDYETFGEHQWKETKIFDFLEGLPGILLGSTEFKFITPSEACEILDSTENLDVPFYLSWADVERDLSAWRSNAMQHEALEFLYSLEQDVFKVKDASLIKDWRDLQTSDHFYYMCTKFFSDGDVHKYFNPFNSPREAFLSFMKAAESLRQRVDNLLRIRRQKRVRLSKRVIKENFKNV